MPRKYIRKTNGPSYSEDDLIKAVRDVENKNCTYSQAKELYGVPISVIFHRIKGRKVPIDKMGRGRNTALTPQDELDLVNCLKARARMGYPCNMEDTIGIVADFVKANVLKTPFTNGVPGKDWYYGFLQRHPTLSVKKPEMLQKNRQTARKPDIIYDFYSELSQVMNECDLNHKDKACFVFNCDESGFGMDPTRIKAIGEKGSPLVRISGGSGRESTTVLGTISADGNYLPPFIVFKGTAVQPRWVSEHVFPGTCYAASSNGWMEEAVFFQWFTSAFIPYLKKLRDARNCPEQKALLLFDGHCSHISYRIIQTAINNKIVLLKFPSHLTDRMQPLDKCVFGPVKTSWEKKLVQFGKSQLQKRDTCRLSKGKFGELIGEVWSEAITSKNIISGFQTTGLFPVDATKFPESFFNPKELNEYKKSRALVPYTSSPTNFETQQNIASAGTCGQSSVAGPTDNEQTPIKPSSSKNRVSPATPTGIIEIFTSKMMNNESQVATSEQEKKKRKIPRLKPERYGEVLTTEEVLLKVKENEEKLQEKERIKEDNKRKRILKRKEVPLKRKLNFGKIKTAHNSKVKKTISKQNIGSLCSDESDDDIELLKTQILRESLVEVTYEDPDWLKLKQGQFILVDILGGARNKTHYKYVCSIQHKDDEDGDIVVSGFLREDQFSTQFVPKENDTFTITYNQIIAILPHPEIKFNEKRKMVHEFSGTVSVFEK